MPVTLLSIQNGVKNSGRKTFHPNKPITEIITNGFFTVDRKWTVIYWNKAAESLLGVSAKSILGKNIWEEFAGIIPLNFYSVYHKAFNQTVPVHFEEYWGEVGAWFDVITYHCDDTLSVSFKTSNQPIHPEYAGDPVQQLRILNELYRFVTEVTNDCLWEWDLESKEIFWIDGGHKRVFGYPIENALIPQEFWESRIHPEDRERVMSRLNETITGTAQSVWIEDYRFQKVDGEYAWVHDRGHIVFDENKKPSRMIGATQDITARKIAEIGHLESERRLSLMSRQTMNVLMITDKLEKITWVNNAFTRLTEYKSGEVTGREFGSFLHGKETDPVTINYIRQNIRARQRFDCEILRYSKHGNTNWMHVQGQPLFDAEQNFEGYLIIEKDITDKLKFENKLKLERQNRLREITRAVLTAQENERAEIGKELHDNLNQVLAVAKLYLQMGQSNGTKRDSYLEKSHDLIVKVIEEIRKLSKKLIIPSRDTIGLFDNIRNLLSDLSQLHPIKIEFEVEGVSEEILNEKIQLTIFRITQEQLNNVLKHAEATKVKIMLTREKDNVRLLITDNGKGMDNTKRSTGVGIINIKSRTELYHGKTTINTQPGRGFELIVDLPLDLSHE